MNGSLAPKRPPVLQFTQQQDAPTASRDPFGGNPPPGKAAADPDETVFRRTSATPLMQRAG
jgi:hypothetical protein